mgnify:CR=1 FL=1
MCIRDRPKYHLEQQGFSFRPELIDIEKLRKTPWGEIGERTIINVGKESTIEPYIFKSTIGYKVLDKDLIVAGGGYTIEYGGKAFKKDVLTYIKISELGKSAPSPTYKEIFGPFLRSKGSLTSFFEEGIGLQQATQQATVTLPKLEILGEATKTTTPSLKGIEKAITTMGEAGLVKIVSSELTNTVKPDVKSSSEIKPETKEFKVEIPNLEPLKGGYYRQVDNKSWKSVPIHFNPRDIFEVFGFKPENIFKPSFHSSFKPEFKTEFKPSYKPIETDLRTQTQTTTQTDVMTQTTRLTTYKTETLKTSRLKTSRVREFNIPKLPSFPSFKFKGFEKDITKQMFREFKITEKTIYRPSVYSIVKNFKLTKVNEIIKNVFRPLRKK